MSVTTLLQSPEVCKLLDIVIPPSLPKRITVSLVVPPMTKDYSLVGTAFDYALRFELERRCPHVKTQKLIAELVPSYISSDGGQTAGGIAALLSMGEVDGILSKAKACAARYVRNPKPTKTARETMIAHAIRLARLDPIARVGALVFTEDMVDPEVVAEDVKDISHLLGIVPFNVVAHPQTLLLNPTFGRYSFGADCDLISGDRLIDIKVTKNEAVKPNWVRQLVSYLILARAAHEDDSRFPDISSVGIYFARHGHLWAAPAELFVNHGRFREVANEYIRLAEAAYETPLESPPLPAPHTDSSRSAGSRRQRRTTTRRDGSCRRRQDKHSRRARTTTRK